MIVKMKILLIYWQLNTTFVNDVGLHLSLSGCSEAALEFGRRLGFCGHPKTIRRFRRSLADDNRRLVNARLKTALDNDHLALLVVDDFHSIHSVQRPTSSETSQAFHFATAITDIHSTIPGLTVQGNASAIHYCPSENFPRGGIAIAHVAENIFLKIFLTSWQARGYQYCHRHLGI